ncbi:UbiA prenyltransferase family [Earliella scabrosa]|nr:UbiA prenyltransferase family [Earliella scabrosa]
MLYHLHTILLFTWADYKTILFPISVFASVVAPVHSLPRLLLGMLWIWSHQLMCNVSNQARSKAEDALNKPWRPLPAGRLSECQAGTLRWVVVIVNFALSAWLGGLGSDLVLTTFGLLVTTYLYDELGFSNHCLGKNFCNIWGYTMIEIGATKLMGSQPALDRVSMFSVGMSGAVIFTTIQAQDFADVEGDRELGRATFPLYAPEMSRIVTLLALVLWSAILSVFWELGPVMSFAFIAVGLLVGTRYYVLRSADADRSSYVLYNIWMILMHILPLNARVRVLSF